MCLSTRKDSKYKMFIGFLISGAIITAIGLYVASGGYAESWELMGRVIPSTEWCWYMSALGIILLLIGGILAYFYFKKK
jgi:hypothetical protein